MRRPPFGRIGWYWMWWLDVFFFGAMFVEISRYFVPWSWYISSSSFVEWALLDKSSRRFPCLNDLSRKYQWFPIRWLKTLGHWENIWKHWEHITSGDFSKPVGIVSWTIPHSHPVPTHSQYWQHRSSTELLVRNIIAISMAIQNGKDDHQQHWILSFPAISGQHLPQSDPNVCKYTMGHIHTHKHNIL